MNDAVEARPAEETTAGTPAPSGWLAAWSLGLREWLRFVRQRNRVVGSLGQPLLFWLFFGEGFRETFQLPQAGQPLAFREFFFPGVLVLILLFTAIFVTISIIEDRREGFLQAVLVSPVPNWALVLGKLVGGTAIALVGALVFLLLGLTLNLQPGLLGLAGTVVFLFVSGLGLTGMGFILAWRMDSTQGYHAVMSVVLFPMWLLSGAFFPPPPGVLGYLMLINPMTYAVGGVRQMLYWNAPELAAASGDPPLWLCWAVTVGFCAAMILVGGWVSRTRTKGDLR